jgi:hypothetical protein
MFHRVTLSNGRVLRIEEGDNCLHIASEHNGDVDMYICEIRRSGTLVMPNSGDGPEYLIENLKKSSEQPAERFAQVAWTAADAQTLFKIDEERAEEFLQNNAKHIQERLTELGWGVLETLGRMDGLEFSEPA